MKGSVLLMKMEDGENGKVCPLLLIGAAIRSLYFDAVLESAACVCARGGCEMWQLFGEEGYCGLAGRRGRRD